MKQTTQKSTPKKLVEKKEEVGCVIVIDDSSTDNTLQIMNKIKDGLDTGLESIIQGKMKIISLTDEPDEWTGKTWASHRIFACTGIITSIY